MADVERTLECLANRLIDLDDKIARNQPVNHHVTEEETLNFIESKRNRSTVMKTKSDMKKIKEWLSDDGETRDLEDIPSKELDVLLYRFLLSAKKNKATSGKKSTEFEPSALRGILESVKRYLMEKEYKLDIYCDKEFKMTRDTLKAKCIDLKEKGLGNRQNRADPFTKAEICVLHEKRLLGDATPQSLTNSMWFNNTMHLGLRGRQEHLTMLWSDLELGTTADGVQFLAFTERATKTRKGVPSDDRSFVPKIFEEKGDPNCPIRLYKLYKEKRPSQMQNSDSRFYVGINPRYGRSSSDGQNWFINQPMGKNTIGCLAKKMSEDAGFQARHVNHSGRKSSITSLLDAGCHPTEVAQLSGHNNLMSLNHYNTVNINKQQQMSSIIHSHTSVQSTVTSRTEPSVSADNENDFDKESDEDLIRHSQEIEEALKNIHSYEELTGVHGNGDCNVIDLPVRQSPGGSLHVSKFLNEMPHSLFNSCTFNSSVTVVLKIKYNFNIFIYVSGLLFLNSQTLYDLT